MESSREYPTVWQYIGRIHIYPTGIELLGTPGLYLREAITRGLIGEPSFDGVFEVEMTIKARPVEEEGATE
jgi:hypothetical protein